MSQASVTRCPSAWERLYGSGLLLSHLLALLLWELACTHCKGRMGESRGLDGHDCPLPPLTPQTLLRNGAEPTDLWGLVTKGKDLFLSDHGREQFKLVIYVQKSISFLYFFLPSHLEVHTGQQA